MLGQSEVYLPEAKLTKHQEGLEKQKFQIQVFAERGLLKLLAASPMVGQRDLKSVETGLVHMGCLHTTISYISRESNHEGVTIKRVIWVYIR